EKIFLALQKGRIRAFTRERGEMICDIETKGEDAVDAVISADRKLAVTAHYDAGVVRAWDLEQCALKWEQKMYRPMELHLLPGGSRVFAAADGPVSVLWELDSGEPVSRFETGGRATIGRLTRDGRYFVARVSYGAVLAWRLFRDLDELLDVSIE